MKLVKIINGTYGHKPEGAKFITPAKAGECVTVSDEEAARLVSLRVAVYTGEPNAEADVLPVATPYSGEDRDGAGETPPEGGNGAEGENGDAGTIDIVDGHFTAASLSAMTIESLTKLAADLGADVSKCKKKADYVDVITAIEVCVDDEEPPVTGAAGPVV